MVNWGQLKIVAFLCGAPGIGHTLYSGDSPDLAAEFVCWGCYKVSWQLFGPIMDTILGRIWVFSRVPSVPHAGTKDNILFRQR
jgi:hypothetical protein